MATRSAENSDAITDANPGKNGNRLRVGNPGNRGGTGRPPNEIRAGFRESLPAEVKKLEQAVRRLEKLAADLEAVDPVHDPDSIDRRQKHIRLRMDNTQRIAAARERLAEFKARYGLGTTQTQTDTRGNDAAVLGRLTPADQRAELLRLLGDSRN